MAPALVAVPAYHLPKGRLVSWRTGGFAIPEQYVLALQRAQVTPVLVPSGTQADPGDVLAPFAGLLLAGGGDVDPSRYGAEPHPKTYGVDPERDDTELGLLAAALRAGLPILAICRGMQVVNVACGGTLHQHLPALEGSDVHGDPTASRDVVHAVDVAPGSRVAAAVGHQRLDSCFSHHHQGVERIGSGLVPVAWSDDGLVEALELPPGEPWLVAVQWHPELNAPAVPVQQAIFDAFADRARSR